MAQLVLELRPLLEVHRFCFIKLGLAARELQTMSWAQLVSRVVAAQASMRLCVVKELTALDMVRAYVSQAASMRLCVVKELTALDMVRACVSQAWVGNYTTELSGPMECW